MRHLDLQGVGVDQVFSGNAKAARSHLLDRRSDRVAIIQRNVAGRVFAAFARVGTGAHPVHGYGQGSVRFPGNRTEGHRPGRQPFDDFSGGFYFIQRQRLGGKAELEQAAQVTKMISLIVHRLAVPLELLIVAGTDGMLQQSNGFRGPGVFFATQPISEFATDIECTAIQRGVAESLPVAADGFLSDFVQVDAFDRALGASKIAVNELAGQAHRFKNLRPAIGLVSGNAHFGHNLENALGNSLGVMLMGLSLAHLL